jgi:hypothetical protein
LKLLLKETKLPLFKFAIPMFRSLTEVFSFKFFENYWSIISIKGSELYKLSSKTNPCMAPN